MKAIFKLGLPSALRAQQFVSVMPKGADSLYFFAYIVPLSEGNCQFFYLGFFRIGHEVQQNASLSGCELPLRGRLKEAWAH